MRFSDSSPSPRRSVTSRRVGWAARRGLACLRPELWGTGGGLGVAVASAVMVTPQHPLPEHQRRSVAVYDRDWRPLADVVPATARDERRHVRIPGEVVAEGPYHREHAGQKQVAVGRGRSDHLARGLVGHLAEPAEQRCEAVAGEARRHVRDLVRGALGDDAAAGFAALGAEVSASVVRASCPWRPDLGEGKSSEKDLRRRP